MARHLLIYDDNIDVLKFLALTISSQSDWTVHSADQISTAENLIAKTPIDAALIDYFVEATPTEDTIAPDKTGVKLAQQVRAKYPKALIVMMSGRGEHLKAEIEALGFSFIPKPFDFKFVINYLNSGTRNDCPGRSGFQPIEFLVVDDNRPFLDFMRQIFFREPAFKCYTAHSALEAREICTDRSLDAALIDCHLPGESGIELAGWMRRSNPTGVIQLMSAEPAFAAEVRGRDFDFICKPFDYKQVIREIVLSVIRKRKLAGTINVFYSYSHKDERFRTELEKYLVTLERTGIISGWSDRRITAGSEFEPIIDLQLEWADVILLLVSAEFMASPFCYGREMERAMDRHRANEARVVPVILRPVEWQEAPFGRLVALPTDGKPITKWSERAEAFVDISRGIKRVVGELLTFRKQGSRNGE